MISKDNPIHRLREIEETRARLLLKLAPAYAAVELLAILCGKSARTAPLYHCSVCGKPPAILGVLPFTKKEEEFLAARKAVKVMA